MSKKYDNDFKRMLVELFTNGQSAKSLGEEYDVDGSLIRRWKREYLAKNGDLSKKKELSPDQLELKQLKKDLRDVTIERDILKKAVGIFSKSDN
jgi:transposase